MRIHDRRRNRLGYFGEDVSTAASSDQIAFMKTVAGDLTQKYLLGAAKFGISPDNLFQVFVPGASLVLDDASVVAGRDAFVSLGKIIARHVTTIRSWAERGTRDDGSAYTPERWIADAQGYARDVAGQVGIAYDTSWFANLPTYVRQTGKATADPTAWPTWAKLLVGGGGLIGAAYVYNTFRR